MMAELRNLNLLLLIVFGFSICIVNAIDAQEKRDTQKPKAATPADKTEASDKVATVKVTSEPIVIHESFDGVFESTNMKEVKADFDTWTDLKVKNVVQQGAVVTAGQVLVEFDTQSIEKAGKEAEFSLKNSEFDLETARLNMKELKETFELDKALAERTWKNAKEDYEYFKNVQLPDRMDDLAYSEKSAGYFLEYQMDELDQLEQMYTEDELTEESEEIVLKRARRGVESAARNKKRSLRRVERDRETNVPREKVSKEEAIKRSELAYEKSMKTLPIGKQKKEVALAKAEFDVQQKAKKLKELNSDFQKMQLKSPANGVVYHGRCDRGKWVGGAGSPKRELKVDKKVVANTVVMTIVDVGQMMVRADLTETKVHSLSAGLRGKAKLNTPAGIVIPATIKSVSRVAMDSGKYDAQIVVESLPADTVMPGMGCKLSFVVYENNSAVVAPKASVFSDDGGVTHYAYVVKDGGKPTRQSVKVGRVSGDHIEIIDGLSNGDSIAKSKP